MRPNPLFELVQDHMKWDYETTNLWFLTPNPLLGGITPLEYQRMRGDERLEKFIRNLIDENGTTESK